ncbi:hypothetical protein JOD82_005442 [Paenibacillus sp. 1182]|uniref:hypothetical protein n=1 Tax=Paenibacillus sp. 1182 TaxID=2806565 RepID=UPI001AE5A638|nr:hypothetical protein [Paenibacillus sp. 1182]MBP1312297.1 hypothetical protein [Paenibacillus sp. 1182]
MDKKIQEIRIKAIKIMTERRHDTGWTHTDDLLNDIFYVLGQLEIKDKALEFYANKNNHHWGVEEEGAVVESEVMMDYGERARTALKGEDTSE